MVKAVANRDIQVLVLAAGEGRRFGGDKLSALMPAKPLLISSGSCVPSKSESHTPKTILQSTCDNLQAAGLKPVCIVRATDKVLQSQLSEQGIEFLTIAPNQPMSVSLISAVGAFADARGWMLVLGDMPYAQPASYKILLDAFYQHLEHPDPFIIRAYFRENTCGGSQQTIQAGQPVIFSHHFYEELQQVSGDEGARQVIKRHPEDLHKVLLTDKGVLQDVDTPADLV